MSNSTDSLRKKVCVTVFLDELFEEVPEDERKDLKQVNELPESRVKVSDDPYVEPSRAGVGHDEKVNVSPANVDSDGPQILLRPRKHRRESKFSKNRYDSFKKELSKYGYGSGNKKRSREPAESAISDSDISLKEILEVNKWGVSRSSFSELSEIEMTDGSFLSIDPVPSLPCRPGEKPNSGNDESGLSRNKSTQFDGAEPASDTKEGQNAGDDTLPRKGIQKQIQLLVCKVRPVEDETCKGDRLQAPDLTSVLEECVKKNEDVQATPVDDASRSRRESTYLNNSELSDSYTCVFPHNRRRSRARAPEVKRVWANSKRRVWNDGFESDLSEPDCHLYSKRGDLQNDPVLLYASKKSRENVPEGKSKSYTIPPTVQSTSRELFFEGKTPKTPLETDAVIKTVTHLANKTVLETMSNAEQEEETGREGDHAAGTGKRLPSVEGRNKNFAEGDTFENLDAKEMVLVCDDIMKSEETKVIHNEIIVNLAEIELDPKDGNVEVSPEPCPPSEGLPEVLFQKSQNGDSRKSMTDAESELVFAESEHFSGSEVVLGGKYFCDSPGGKEGRSKNEVCVVEFEDKLSRSKILRRMKTVEILGNGSLKDLKNISTEVILICENINDSEVRLEAWQSNASTLRSITNMGQCYLKDSRDSAMYLIEIPLQFTNHSVEKSSDSDQLFKASDSD